MSESKATAAPDAAGWTRAAMIVVRVALLVFLLWALVSARFPAETPIAEDAAPPSQNSHSVAEPCTEAQRQLG